MILFFNLYYLKKKISVKYVRVDCVVGCRLNKEMDTCLKSGPTHWPFGKQRFHPPYFLGVNVGAVEALKDQGFCRWNYAMRSIHQHARNKLRSCSQAQKLSSSSSAMASSRVREEKAKQSEESLRTVMYLSCWGPN
ncbi:unnamed protein product, partial [Vitis vinifera]|uniref:Uncharacterized protein n=1 Tax=Vitis vinifera TaxID=29760 RepID=D7TD06_VITVI